MMSLRSRAVTLVAVGVVCLAGCSGDKLNRQAVSGTVNFKGAPLDRGSIEFHPTGGQATNAAGAVENGKFTITAEKGLTPGSYKVIVNAPELLAAPEGGPGSDLTQPPPKERIPPKYNEKTELKAEVKAGGPNMFTFNLD